MATERPGFHLPLLLARAFRELIDELHAELAAGGHADARPLHGFALQAVGPAGATISELGRRLGVSKQAAAKTARNLEELGYVAREPSPDDARASLLRRTPRGEEMLALSADIFDSLRRRWITTVGAERLRAIEDDLETIVGASPNERITDFPGWLR